MGDVLWLVQQMGALEISSDAFDIALHVFAVSVVRRAVKEIMGDVFFVVATRRTFWGRDST